MKGGATVEQLSDKYLRVASLSIALYDYFLTLPAEWRFYKSQKSFLNLSLACTMFILIRYSSILVMTVSNVGVFATNFTPRTCEQYFMVSPVLKVFQAMVSQVILGVRAFNIAGRARWAGCTIATFFILVTVVEWFTNLYRRIPVIDEGNCTSANSLDHLYVWLYYLTAIVYDSVTLAISVFYLLRYSARSVSPSRLITVMLYDGLGYFVLLTASNVFNLIMYKTTPEAIQASGTSLGMAVTWIMSQRILIHLREMSVDLGRLDGVIVSRCLHTPHDVSLAIRSQFEPPKTAVDLEYSPQHTEGDMERAVELDVQVQVERAMTIEYIRPRDDQTDHRPRVQWGYKRH